MKCSCGFLLIIGYLLWVMNMGIVVISKIIVLSRKGSNLLLLICVKISGFSVKFMDSIVV